MRLIVLPNIILSNVIAMFANMTCTAKMLLTSTMPLMSTTLLPVQISQSAYCLSLPDPTFGHLPVVCAIIRLLPTMPSANLAHDIV